MELIRNGMEGVLIYRLPIYVCGLCVGVPKASVLAAPSLYFRIPLTTYCHLEITSLPL